MDLSKNKKYIIIAVIIIAIIAFIWWKNKKKEEVKVTESVEEEKQTLFPKEEIMTSFPLQLGSKGPEVKKLQTWMLKNEGAQIKVDGIWGKETDAAVKKFLKLSQVNKEKYESLIK